jgi:YVTN family beta-propeller protein
MVTHFGKYCRTLLTGLLVFWGAAAVSVVGGSLAASPAVAASPPAWTAYVVSYNDDAVIPVNTATDAVGSPIIVGSGPSAIAITPDGSTAYVTEEGTSNTSPGFVTPIDLSTNTPGAPISVGSGPDAIAITPNGLTAYVGNYNDDTVTPVNLVTNAAGKAIPVGGAPTSIAITPDGTTAYIGRAFDSGIQLDLTTNSTQPGASASGFASAITPDGATVVATSPQDNNVDVVNPATDTGTTVAALNDPEGVAITPGGSTAYVAYSPFTTNKGALLPIPVADPNAPATPINLGTNSAYAVAITPDGSTAFVTDLTGGNVVPVDLTSDTAGAPIPLGGKGTNPIAIAIAPDQAPVAHLHVNILGNLTDSFDASASTVAYGSIASYAWNFGDGTTETTTTPTVTHTYAQPADNGTASVTETSSTGTSTGEVFTGQTASRSGGTQATASATVYTTPADAQFYPTVSAVSPTTGPTYEPTTVTITGTGFVAGNQQTMVYVGGIAAANVTVTSPTTIMATLPAQSGGLDDVIVTSEAFGTVYGSSAATPADQFTYSTSAPPVQASCDSPSCPLPVVQYGSTTVSATVGSDCNQCAYSAYVTNAIPPIDSGEGDVCPSAMAYQQSQITVSESGPTVSSPLSVADSEYWAGGLNWGSPNAVELGGIKVCADTQAITGAASAPSRASGRNASPAGGLGQDILLKKCARNAVAPCVQQVGVSGHVVDTKVLLPVNESITLTIGPQKETIKKLAPKKGAAPGSHLSITGTNLFQVSAVIIDGDPVGGGLVGGLEASIVSETAKKLVVTVPSGASTGPVTLIGKSGEVTSSAAFKVT